MDAEPIRRPRVARETRLLLGVAVLAVVALWALARLRFPERSPSQQVVAPILAPLIARQGFAGLESQLSDATARIGPSLAVVRAGAGDRQRGHAHHAALRLQREVGVWFAGRDDAIVPDAGIRPITRDVTGLTIVTMPQGPAAPVAASWFRGDPVAPRYVLQTSASEAGVALAPVLVGGLVPEDAALWTGSLWRASTGTGLTPGSFLFTPDGEWIGLAVMREGRPAIVPADVVARLADARLAQSGGAMTLGVHVQAMTPALAELLAFPNGVAVTHVDADGPAADILQVGDVVHAADGRPLPTLEHWHRLAADLGPRPVELAVWRAGASRTLALTPGPLVAPAAPAPPAATSRPPGLGLRRVPGQGSVVTALPPESPLAAAGVRVGDLITRLGDTDAPTPAAVRAALAAPNATGVLAAVTRDGTHALVVIAP